jgi:hypothetical protein
MLRSAKEVLECTVFAKDGILGTVDDIFFDDDGRVSQICGGKDRRLAARS